MGDAVGGKLEVVWDDALAAYDFGPGHPLAPVRVELTMALARGLGSANERRSWVSSTRIIVSKRLNERLGAGGQR